MITNKNDKSTVISIVPFEIVSVKPGLYPGRFVIKPAKDDEHPSFLTIGTSRYILKPDEETPAIEVPTPSYEVARSIVEDYTHASLFATDTVGPGIMYVIGAMDLTTFMQVNKSEHTELKLRQRRWWEKLVRSADDDWKRYHNHKVISDTQRYACEQLQLEREWLVQIEASPVKCPACQTQLGNDVVVCPNCKCILKAEEYKKLTFAS